MTRILVTADTHAPRRRLPDWIVRAAARADMIVHAGDVCDAATLEVLGALAPVYAVRGNNDGDLALPQRLLLDVAGVRIGVVHGDEGRGRTTPERALRAFGEDAAVVVFGHSHERLHEDVRGILLLNPGSPTKPRRGPASAAWLDVAQGAAQVRFLSAEG